MANSVVETDRVHESRRAGDGLLGWLPAIVVGYATLLMPLLLQQSTYSASDPSAAAPTSQGTNLGNQVFWLLLFFAVLYACRDKLNQVTGLLRRPLVAIILVYMVAAFASILWSPAPAIAFRRAMLQFIVIVAVILPTLLVDHPKAQIDRLLGVLFITIAVNLAAVVLLPASRLGHEGIYSHKNDFGLVVAYGFLFCIYGLVRLKGPGRFVAVVMAAAALMELMVSRSKTSLGLAILVPLVALMVVAISRFLRVNALFPLVFGLAASILCGVFAAYLVDFSFADLSMLLFDDTTFTGRTTIWNFLADVIGRAPLLGQGYGSFWDIGSGSIALREAPGFVTQLLQGHNGYIDVSVELGMFGLVTLLLFLCGVIHAIGRVASDDRIDVSLAWLLLSCAVIGLCHNMLESSWFRGYSVVWMIFLLVGGWAAAVRK